jgi:hypothetical protein
MIKIFKSIYNKKYFLVILIIVSFPLYSDSIFTLSTMDSIIILKSNSTICRIKQKNLINDKNTHKKDCEVVQNNLSRAEDILRKNNPDLKEIIYAFYSDIGEREYPVLSNEKNEYKVITIIFNKKDNKHKLELTDKLGRYFYLEKKIELLKIKE